VRRVIALLICVSTLATSGSTQEAPTPPGGAPAATTSVPPSAAPGRAAVADSSAKTLRIDLSTAISEVVARMLEAPRFEEHVEVRDHYQEALDVHLRAAELACGATESGPPSDGEMNRFRETRIPPHADLLAGTKWLNRMLRRLFSAKTPRYFLYSVRRVSAPSVSYTCATADLGGRTVLGTRHDVGARRQLRRSREGGGRTQPDSARPYREFGRQPGLTSDAVGRHRMPTLSDAVHQADEGDGARP
jgi:hypothetical protein